MKRVVEAYGISVRKACWALDWPRSSHHYRSTAADTTALRMRMRELAMARPRYGYRRIHVLLGREGWHVNHKKILRLYREEGLSLRIRRKKRKSASWLRVPPPRPARTDERWAVDFMSDALINGQRFRVMTVIDVHSRECVALDAARSFPSARATAILDRSISERSKPSILTLDNGTEFTCKHFDAWAYQRKISLDFIRPGKPVENCFIESFNGRLRDECLNMHWFVGLDEARQVLEDWRRDYNTTRPHSSLADRVPAAYVQQLLGLSSAAVEGDWLQG